MDNTRSDQSEVSATTVVAGPQGLRSLVGSHLGPSRPLTVDQERITTFADVTEDRQWIHVDPERSAKGPFGATIAHGYLTLSLCAHFMQELLEVRDVSMAINYGLDRVRFPSPVPVGSRIYADAEALELTEVPGGVQSKFRLTITQQGSDKPACVADVIFRYYT